MDRSELKRRILNSEPTPGVPDALVWDVLAECIADQTGQQPRLVTLVESGSDRMLPGTTAAVARLFAELGVVPLAEASDRPRSDLKSDDRANSPRPGAAYLPDGVDLAAAMRRAAAGYRQDGVTLNTPVVKPTPITLTEWRAELAARIPDPIQRAYVVLSGRDR